MIRRARRFAAVILLALATVPVAAEQPAGDWQVVEKIAAAAERHIYKVAGDTSGKLVVTAGFLDPRLQLPRCSETLDPFLRPGTRLSGRVIVGIRCNAGKAWKIYMPMHVGIMDEVVVTRRALLRGHIIAAGDIDTERRDVSTLRGDYLAASSNVIGQRLTRAVVRGIVLQPSLLQDQTLIEKGQAVTLSVRSDSIAIQMAGIAVSNGSADALIQVRNLASGKIVEGRVRSQNVVEVALH